MDSFKAFIEAAAYDVAGRAKVGHYQRHALVERHKDDPDVFGSFTALPKLGINPKSEYATPTGVYAYPVAYLDSLWSPTDGTWHVPFAAEQPYLHLFRNTRPDAQVHFRPGETTALTEPGDGQVEAYERILLPVARQLRDLVLQSGEEPVVAARGFLAEQLGDDAEHRLGVPLDMARARLASLIRVDPEGFAGAEPETVARVVASHQAKAAARYLNRYPLEDRVRRLFDQVNQNPELTYETFKRYGVLGETQRLECDAAFAWNATRRLSRLRGVVPARWTAYLRAIGVRSCQDHGTGTIYPSEPFQAVFLDVPDLKVIEVIDNRRADALRNYGLGDELGRQQYDQIRKKLLGVVVPIATRAKGGTAMDEEAAAGMLSWVVSAAHALRNHGQLDPGTVHYLRDMVQALRRGVRDVDRGPLAGAVATLQRIADNPTPSPR